MDNNRLIELFNDSPDEFSSTSESDEQEDERTEDFSTGRRKNMQQIASRNDSDRKLPQNIVKKLLNRELTGYLGCNARKISRVLPFKQVPSRLAFHLKEIIPYCYLDGHVFMGLSACGQFLLSYKVSYDEESINHYNFSAPYKYELFFWIYRPHCMLVNYYKICLFDDHGVDSMKTVTMTQWLNSTSRFLIVHGASEAFHEDSYITITSVPKLGCRECIQLRDNELDRNFARGSLCIKCNLTIHTKYGRIDSDPVFVPQLNLNCPDRIVIVANGFIHAVHVKLEMNRTEKKFVGCPQMVERTREPVVKVEGKAMKKQEDDAKTIVARIIADFAECETETVPLEKTMIFSRIDKSVLDDNRSFDELIITCGSGAPSVTSHDGGSGSEDAPPANRSLTQRNYQINAKAPVRQVLRRNCWKSSKITTVDLQGSCSSSMGQGGSKILDAAKTYEFSEDTEKCEKISLFRKRRLADKKYEFSEENTENIIPFNRMRVGKIRKSSPVASGSSVFSASPPNYAYEMPSHHHRASPSQGFRSPCGSPVGNRCLRSPPGYHTPPLRTHCFNPRSPTYAKPFGILMSPRHRRSTSVGTTGSGLFLSPKRDCATPEVLDRPLCSKKFERRFVEEDDAASVITSEEDDCISPGYHLSLPMEVHGSCYSDMQMISQTSYQRLQCPTVVITQNSIDLEALTFHVANHLCQRHEKQYGVFYDWACEVTSLCPFSGRLTCLLLVHFTATEKNHRMAGSCLTCTAALDCVYHRRHFHARTLFTWDTVSGEWNVEDYGDLHEVNSATTKNSAVLAKAAGALAKELRLSRKDIEIETDHLRVLDSCNEKSKESLCDLRNCIEFYRTSSGARRKNFYAGSLSSVDGFTADTDDDEDADVFF
ncbi:uncharacterized protein DMENIID0001_017690 [Sergentomyia squamirostris]